LLLRWQLNNFKKALNEDPFLLPSELELKKVTGMLQNNFNKFDLEEANTKRACKQYEAIFKKILSSINLEIFKLQA
jgi:hypothetical protein